jgi:hypothetical protein
MEQAMTIEQLKKAFYSIRGVEFVEFDVKDRLLSLSIGVEDGRFEAVCANQHELDELVDIVDVHQSRAICNKKRSLKVKFVGARAV